MNEVPICFRLDREAMLLALALAWAKTGKRMAARIAMMAITTRSSIRVNALRACLKVMTVRSVANRSGGVDAWAAGPPSDGPIAHGIRVILRRPFPFCAEMPKNSRLKI